MQVMDDAKTAIAQGALLVEVFGSPTLVMPEHVQEAVREAAGKTFTRDTRGSHQLRKTIAIHLEKEYGVDADPDKEILITHGAMHGLGVTFRALLSLGDEVIVPSPTFFFDNPIRQAGALPIYVQALESQDWRWDINQFEKAITSKTRAVLICNPTNPTGYLPSRIEVEALINWASTHNLLVIADEAYARYLYDGRTFTPQMLFQKKYDKLVTVTSLTKNYGFGNWRVAYIHAPEPFLSQIHRQFEWDALDVGPVPQAAANAVIGGSQAWIEPVMATYQPNRDRLMAGLKEIGLPAVLPASTPFSFVDFSALGLGGRDLEMNLLAHGVAAVAGDAFNGPETFARITFGGSQSAIDALIHALAAIMAQKKNTTSNPRGR